ncbi:MAG TPA: response regulator transcription factor [Dehalococcoidia bacterium]|nr:response regulator transcription factor [Dehalococcoidia bacterium]
MPAREAISVLIADPSAIRRLAIGDVLRRHKGIVLIGEADGEASACAMSADHQPAVCLAHAVLLSTSPAWLDRLHSAAPYTTVLVYGANPAADTASELLRAGVRGLIAPDTTAAQFVQLLSVVGSRQVERRGPGSNLALPVLLTSDEGVAPPRAAAPARLTGHQLEVLDLVAAGHSNREIAWRLGRSEHTVRAHLRTAYRRIGARNRAQAVSWLIGAGLYQEERPPGGIADTDVVELREGG